MFGLHAIDIIVIFLYLVILILIGYFVAKRIKNEADFLVGGRGLGRLLQTFMNFGMATSADAPVGVSREAYRQGASGIWLQLFQLFATPFYWLTTIWQRRLRLSSMGEYYGIRFQSPLMEKFFSIVGILFLTVIISLGLVAFKKTVESVIPKEEKHLTLEEKEIIQNFERFKVLEEKSKDDEISYEEKVEFEKLKGLRALGKVKSSIPAVDPRWFMIIVAFVLLLYTLAGGIIAAAITDLLQGLLLIVLSFLLLPSALKEVGWFSGLHAKLEASTFNLIGNANINEYPWYYIAALVLVGLAITESSPHNMQVMGSAKDEEAARVGRLNGNFIKRFVIVFWGFTGIVGLALYGGQLSDPDLLWGHMTRNLLVPGLIGLMIVCILAALQSTASAMMVASSALFVKNLYEPLVPNKSEQHYVNASRIVSGVVLAVAILLVFFINDFLLLIRLSWSVGLVFGPVFWIGMIWRKTTKTGAWAGIIYGLVFTLFLSEAGSSIKPFARIDYLCSVNENNDGVFFSEVVLEHPLESDSNVIGIKRFRASLLIPAAVGVNLDSMRKADLISLGYYLDVFFPILIMIIVSLLTKQCRKEDLDKFFGRMYTPVKGTAEDDEKAMILTMKDPTRFNHKKIFPNSSIEILKPNRRDIIGFLICVGVAGCVLGLLYALVNIGG